MMMRKITFDCGYITNFFDLKKKPHRAQIIRHFLRKSEKLLHLSQY